MEKCSICNKQFSNKSNLRKHVKNIHEKNQIQVRDLRKRIVPKR